jgi:hypothetical protein
VEEDAATSEAADLVGELVVVRREPQRATAQAVLALKVARLAFVEQLGDCSLVQ